MYKKVEISHKTIIFTVLFLLGLWFLYFLREILLQLFVALLLMTILEPLVGVLGRLRIPRAISVLVTYVLVIGLVGGMFALIVPTLTQQTTNFASALPGYFSNLGINSIIGQDLMSEVLSQLGNIPGQILNFTVSAFSNIISVISVLVFAFYMLLGREKLQNQLGLLFGESKSQKIWSLIDTLDKKLGKWARGQLILMFTIGLATYLGLLLIGIPFALPLAILAGLFEIIPILGPIISAIPAILIGFGISPLVGIGVLALAVLIQQVENYVLVPKIMEKSVGVSPLIILIAIAIGAKLVGITGVLIAIPVIITLQVLTKQYLFKN